jgi:hypothetical protein
MELRTFRANDGSRWTVRLIRAESAGRVPGTPTEWLAFQSETGTERRRLLEIPARWAELSDERMDLLRRMAEPVTLFTSAHSPSHGGEGRDLPSGEPGK